MKTTKKLISILLSVVLMLGCVLPASATEKDIGTVIDESLEYLHGQVPQAKFGSEWSVMALASGNCDVSESYYSDYVDSVAEQIESKGGVLSQSTDYSRVIMGLSAIGHSPEDVGGYNLLEALADYEFVSKQGLNGPVYALIALDSGNYDIPQAEVDELATRQMYVDFVLSKELDNGGWTFWGDEADPDMTSMALQALSPYTNQSKVSDAVNRGLDVLSDMQSEETGGFASWGVEGAESVAQIIIALCNLDIDADIDERFVKGENSALDNLMSFYLDDGSFTHALDRPSSNLMATQQSLLALVAYDKYLEGEGDIYDYMGIVSPNWENRNTNEEQEDTAETVSNDGWKKIDGNWVYCGEDGQTQTSWKQIGASWYYFNSDGIMVTGWVNSNGNWYYMHSVGSMAVGWTQVGPSWFYFGANGAMLRDTVTPDGYTVNENGNWIA